MITSTSGNPDKSELVYMLWAVLAVQGLMADADGFLKQYKKQIYQVARKLSMKAPREMEVYRGILLTPEQVEAGEAGQTIKEPYPVEFISFTDILEVACWFASPDSFMAEYVLNQRPDSEGFIIEHTVKPSDLLFHYEWHNILGIDRNWDFIEHNLGMNGLHTDLSQYDHNIRTQGEIITKPTTHKFELIPKDDRCKQSGRDLDKKYLPKQFR